MTREVLEHWRYILGGTATQLERIASNYEGNSKGKMISDFITGCEEILWGKNSQYREFRCCLILRNIHACPTL